MGVIRPAQRNCQSATTTTIAKTCQRLEDAKTEVEALRTQNEDAVAALKSDMANALSDVQPKKSQ